MQKKSLLLLLLAGSIFLFLPTNKAKAANYICQSAWGKATDGYCEQITAANFTEAHNTCYAWCVDKERCDTLQTDSCPVAQNHGCFAIGSGQLCQNVSAVDPAVAEFKCKNLCTAGYQWAGYDCQMSSAPCPELKEYGCIQDGVCTNIQESLVGNAAAKCYAPCQANPPQKQRCDLIADNSPCPATASAPGPAAGASVDDLKNQAQSLNKAGFKSPADVINRAIQILLAFIGSIALALYVYSGFLWMTASGNSEQVSKAKTTMVWTTLGVVMMLASYMLASFLFKSLGL